MGQSQHKRLVECSVPINSNDKLSWTYGVEWGEGIGRMNHANSDQIENEKGKCFIEIILASIIELNRK